MDYHQAITTTLRHFDVYDVTCTICMSIYTNPVIVCGNGHTLCKHCNDKYNQNVHPVDAECPYCKDRMLPVPIPNRSAEYSIRWFNQALREVVPFVVGDRVDFNLGVYQKKNPSPLSDLPPFVCAQQTDWCSARIHDMDLQHMTYTIVPDLPVDLLKTLSVNCFQVRVSFADVNPNILTRFHEHTTPWRNIKWLKDNAVYTVFYKSVTAEWIPGILLWDRQTATSEDVLIGYHRLPIERKAEA